MTDGLQPEGIQPQAPNLTEVDHLVPGPDSLTTASTDAAVTPLQQERTEFEHALPAGDATDTDMDLLVHTPERREIDGYSPDEATELVNNPNFPDFREKLMEAQADLIEARAARTLADKAVEAKEQAYDKVMAQLDAMLPPEPDKDNEPAQPTTVAAGDIYTRGQQTPAEVTAEAPGVRVAAVEIPADASYGTTNNLAGAAADAQANTLGANPRPLAGEWLEPTAPPSDQIITSVPKLDTETPAQAAPEVKVEAPQAGSEG